MIIAMLILPEWPFFPNPLKGGMYVTIRGDELQRADNHRVRQEQGKPVPMMPGFIRLGSQDYAKATIPPPLRLRSIPLKSLIVHIPVAGRKRP